MRVAYTGRVPPAPLPDELVEFLKGPHAAVVATVRSDGAPYSAATWYDWDDGRILVNMDFERLRLSHMRATRGWRSPSSTSATGTGP